MKIAYELVEQFPGGRQEWVLLVRKVGHDECWPLNSWGIKPKEITIHRMLKTFSKCCEIYQGMKDLKDDEKRTPEGQLETN